MMPSLQGKLSVERMCSLAQVSRTGFYRWLANTEPAAEETRRPCSHSGDCVRAPPPLRIPPHYGRTSASRHGGESQARSADDAGRQPARDPQTKVRLDDGFAALIRGLCQSGRTNGTDWAEPAVGGRFDLHTSAGGIRLPGGHSRCVLPARRRLGLECKPPQYSRR